MTKVPIQPQGINEVISSIFSWGFVLNAVVNNILWLTMPKKAY